MRRDGIGPVDDVPRKSIFCARADACGTNVPAISLASAGLATSSFRIWLETLACPLRQAALFFCFAQSRREGRAMMTFFRHYRQHGPVNALQMRLQG